MRSETHAARIDKQSRGLVYVARWAPAQTQASAEPQGSPKQLRTAAPLSDPSLGLLSWLLPGEAGP